MLYRLPFGVHTIVNSFLDLNQQLALACVNHQSADYYLKNKQLMLEHDRHWPIAFEALDRIRALSFIARKMALLNYRVDAYLRISLFLVGVAGVAYQFVINKPLMLPFGIAFGSLALSLHSVPLYLPHLKPDFDTIKNNMNRSWVKLDEILRVWKRDLLLNNTQDHPHVKHSIELLKQFNVDFGKMVDQVGEVPNRRCRFGSI